MIKKNDVSVESQRQVMQAKIDAGKSPAERNRLGQFATPHALAVNIAEYVVSLLSADRKISFADPAVGSGSFFSAILSAIGRNRIADAVGIEIDPVFADAADLLWSSSGLRVLPGDFTRIVDSASRPAPPDLVLANPPYVRHHHLTRDDKLRLHDLTKRLTGVRVNGLSGLYVYFLLLATAWMKDGGLAAVT
jgi:adenine-specific DNA-methyltransferase